MYTLPTFKMNLNVKSITLQQAIRLDEVQKRMQEIQRKAPGTWPVYNGETGEIEVYESFSEYNTANS